MKCEACKIDLPEDPRGRAEHLRQHGLVLTWKCPSCGLKVPSRRLRDLRIHIARQHEGSDVQPQPEQRRRSPSRHGSPSPSARTPGAQRTHRRSSRPTVAPAPSSPSPRGKEKRSRHARTSPAHSLGKAVSPRPSTSSARTAAAAVPCGSPRRRSRRLSSSPVSYDVVEGFVREEEDPGERASSDGPEASPPRRVVVTEQPGSDKHGAQRRKSLTPRRAVPLEEQPSSPPLPRTPGRFSDEEAQLEDVLRYLRTASAADWQQVDQLRHRLRRSRARSTQVGLVREERAQQTEPPPHIEWTDEQVRIASVTINLQPK